MDLEKRSELISYIFNLRFTVFMKKASLVSIVFYCHHHMIIDNIDDDSDNDDDQQLPFTIIYAYKHFAEDQIKEANIFLCISMFLMFLLWNSTYLIFSFQ